MYRYIIYFFLLSICIIFDASAQKKIASSKKNSLKSYMQLSNETEKNTDFNFKSEPRFEIQNGKLNVAVISDNNMLFELNGIDEKCIKDTTLYATNFKITFIRNQTEKAWQSKAIDSTTNLIVSCKSIKNGSPITLKLKGKIYSGSNHLDFNGVFTGKVPDRKNTTTFKTN